MDSQQKSEKHVRGGSIVAEYLLTVPSFVWLCVFFLIPTILVFAIAFRTADPFGGIDSGWTLETVKNVLRADYVAVFWRTIWELRSHGNMLAAWNTSRILDSAAKSKIPLLVFIGCHNTAVDEFPNTYFRMARTPASRRISAANAFMAWAYSRRPISAK